MKLIDLTRPISNELEGITISQAKTVDKDGWNATTLSIYSHSGTHVDAPLHFDVTPVGIDQMVLDSFWAHCWIANCQDVAPSELITVDHLGNIGHQIQYGDGLIIRTGWSEKWGTQEFRDELPRISIELAEYLVKQGVKLLGVEPPSVADVNNLEEVTTIHNILLHGNVTILEGLINLEALSNSKVLVMALPLNIINGDGSPVRAVAIEGL